MHGTVTNPGWIMVTVQGTVTSSGWIINPVHAAGLSPAQYKVVCVVFGSIPAQFCFRFDPFKNLQKKNTFSKTFMIFSHIFLSILINIDSFFIYRKNTNAVLKYPVFVKTLKKLFFYFHAYGQVSQRKITSYFHTTKIQKICISMYLNFNNQFIKITRTRPLFEKTPKKYYLFF